MSKKLKNEVIKFYNKVYKNRPFEKNIGGCGFLSSFTIYSALKKIRPKLIVESGVLRGQGTYFLRKACPNAKIISIDIYPEKRIYTLKKNTKYSTKDFYEHDWSKIPKNSLVFFDDHVNQFTRFQQSFFSGFKHVLFDDNKLEDDFMYTLKQVKKRTGFSRKYRKSNRYGNLIKKIFEYSKQEIKKVIFSISNSFGKKIFKDDLYYIDLDQLYDIKKKNFHFEILKKNTNQYIEFAPIFKPSNNDKDLKKPIFKKNFLNDNNIQDHFSHITYIENKLSN